MIVVNNLVVILIGISGFLVGVIAGSFMAAKKITTALVSVAEKQAKDKEEQQKRATETLANFVTTYSTKPTGRTVQDTDIAKETEQ